MLSQVCMHPALQAKGGGKLEKVLIGRDVVSPTPLAPWAAFTFCAELDNALKNTHFAVRPFMQDPSHEGLVCWCAGCARVLGVLVCWVCWCAGCAGWWGEPSLPPKVVP